MSDWRQVPLSEVVTRVTTKNVDRTNENVLTVSAERGLIAQESFFTKRVASKDTSGYYVVAPGQFVYNKSTSKSSAYGTVARNLSDMPGIVSPLYFVFEAKDRAALPEYLELALNSNQFFGSLAGMLREGARAHGLLNVRLKEFYAATVTLPPAPTQGRIVEVMGAVDDQIAALETEAGVLSAVLRRRRADLITDESVEAVRAEHAFDFSTGVRRTPDRATGPYMTPYLRSANVGYGTLDLSDVLEMNYDPAERKKFSLQYGDVVVSEGSASANAVGMPAMWRDELPGPVCTQMTLLRLRAREGVCIPEFVFHWSMWAYEARAFLDVAGGTNIKHISAKRAKGMAVRLPSLVRQREMAVELDAMESALEATRAEAVRLRDVRVRLLSGLLDRTIDIESGELEI
ncbi:restriction endonuclease subunit S domain-containing protein [Streptomyces albidochromogenes]|uniref:Restriction endonuclease subunit S n=1 Tax=Streptomyces albidochromogenes TaxID=329524 RepID=A0ABW6FL26_9ACTN